MIEREKIVRQMWQMGMRPNRYVALAASIEQMKNLRDSMVLRTKIEQNGRRGNR